MFNILRREIPVEEKIDKTNTFILVKEDGSFIYNPVLSGLKVKFSGENSLVKIYEGSVFKNVTINISNNSTVIIHKTHHVGLTNVTFAMAGASVSNFVELGEGLSISQRTRFALENTDNASVIVGKNNMWSSEITIRASDGHQIVDIASGDVINRARPIIIGDNVWIGSSAVIMKGAEIPNNTIIGQSAVVAGQFTEENTVLAGNSARVVRRGVTWNREYVTN